MPQRIPTPRPAASNAENVFKSTVYETEHPVVQVHPLTGERAIVLVISVRRPLPSVRQTRRVCLPCCRIT
jgi:alpha-ketoglutarate-dependent taurine dioxygenase